MLFSLKGSQMENQFNTNPQMRPVVLEAIKELSPNFIKLQASYDANNWEELKRITYELMDLAALTMPNLSKLLSKFRSQFSPPYAAYKKERLRPVYYEIVNEVTSILKSDKL